MNIDRLARIVPRARREEWLAEWRAELAFLADRPEARAALAAGAFHDAIHLRLEWAREMSAPGTPLRLLSSLAAITCMTAIVAANATHIPGKAPAYAFMIAFGLLILPATMPMSRGDYTSIDNRQRRLFFLAKMILVLAAGYFVWCAALPYVKYGAVQFTMAGCVAALRWAILEQRRRCPVCLRRLQQPVRVGQPSYTLLGWSGTEWICTQGHGVLHEPIAPTTSFMRHTWSRLMS